MSVRNFGCRLNLSEGDAVAALGLGSDVIVINTCAVTNEAVRQAAQAVRRAAREVPGARIVVTGCAATLDPARFAAMPGVDRVVANADKLDRGAYPLPLRERATQPQAERGEGYAAVGKLPLSPIAPERESPSPSRGEGSHTRAFVEVQTGCDHRCTFCIIPFARGPARSVDAATVVDRIARLVGSGTREVILTGVDLTSYRPSLGMLVQRILRDVPELPRLRLSSLDSIEVDSALVDALADRRVMPQLHLSLQSGDDMILKRMARRHGSADAIEFCARVRTMRPDVQFGADFITGFPTETDAMFANTLAHVDDCGLTQLHVFPFSARAGTPAARMPQLPTPVRRARARVLRAAGAARLQTALTAQLGRRQRILVEADGTSGHTEHYLPARLTAPAPRGSIASVTAITVADGVLECR